ncbi:MAG: helix-turn-helix transcriptional regulator [Actinobacteria bacterium]|nr:helix-turn-helix transcriptional regulator [Actinomycetota bacterium]
MARTVKPRRRYDSPRRREQAEATRLAILEAAERLFGERGYANTSIAEIAAAAGVALKTVYAVFGTKAEVLRALWNLRVRGDEEPVPVAERDWFRAVLAEPDPRRRLALVAHNARLVRGRTATLAEVVRQAAPGDAQIADLWQRFQRELYERGMREVARTLARDRVLAVDRKAAADLLWTLTHPDLYLLLVRERGWKPERYEQWLGDALCRELLG